MPSTLLGSRRGLRRPAATFLTFGATAALALTACSSGASDDGDATETRTITDIAGEVEIPVDPQRIVSVDFYSPAQLVDLGFAPIGVVEGFDDDDPNLRPKQYHEALAGTDTIGTYYELNLEAVLALEPDLIFAETRFLDEGQLERLQEIAPVVQLDASGPEEWKTRSLMIADAVDRTEEAQKQLDSFEARAAEVSAEYADVLEHPFGYVAVQPADGTWATYPTGHFMSVVWDEVGATFREMTDGEAGEVEGGVSKWLSLEHLGKLDNAEYFVFNHGQRESIDTLTGNPLWQVLPAVSSNRVFENVPAGVTSSFVWGEQNLNDLEGVLEEVRASYN